MHLSSQVAWDLSEVGFHFELSELDRYLIPRRSDDVALVNCECGELLSCIFPSDHGLIIKSPPSSPNGLAMSSIGNRALYLESLRTVVCRWLDVPDSLKNCIPFTSLVSHMLLVQKEEELTLFYCQTFFVTAGRAPILPRCVSAA